MTFISASVASGGRVARKSAAGDLALSPSSRQKIRMLIKQADPKVVEEWKWRGVPVWSHDGLICTGETYKSQVTFFKGAQVKDPKRLVLSVGARLRRRAESAALA